MSKVKKIIVVSAIVTVGLLLYSTRSYFYRTWPAGVADAMEAGQVHAVHVPVSARRADRSKERRKLSSNKSRSSTLVEHGVVQRSRLSLNLKSPPFKDSAMKTAWAATSRVNHTVELNEASRRRLVSATDDLPTASTMAKDSMRTVNKRLLDRKGSEMSASIKALPFTPSMATPDSTTTHLWPPAYTQTVPQDHHRHCVLPRDGYKSWHKGTVTQLEPIIHANCTKLFSGDREEADRVKNKSVSWKNSLSNDEFLRKTKNCTWLREELEGNLYNTALERDFPMAYIFVINSRPQAVFRNLKLLFRPQNTFCINFDSKSPSDFKRIFVNIGNCFENIMISSKQENVRWGYFTIMEAQLNCHRDLLNYRMTQPPSEKWKYVINLCGKELPLMSPHEMVSRLSLLNGSSSILSKKVTNKNVYDLKRIDRTVKFSWWLGKPIKTNQELGPIPFNLTFYKSSSYNILSAKFVHFMLTDPIALEVHYYFTKSMHSEEHIYATLFMMPGVPGGFDAKLKDIYVRAAHSTWIYSESSRHELCRGTILNSICIITSGDLPMMMRTADNRTLFHNKYLMERDHTAMDCLEEMIVERNKQEYHRDCLQ